MSIKNNFCYPKLAYPIVHKFYSVERVSLLLHDDCTTFWCGTVAAVLFPLLSSLAIILRLFHPCKYVENLINRELKFHAGFPTNKSVFYTLLNDFSDFASLKWVYYRM